METIEQKLDKLAEFEAQRSLISAHKQEAIDSAITPEVRQLLAGIEVEFANQSQAVDANIAALTEEIKQGVLAAGVTIRGGGIMAVWNKGRTSWDSKKLDGMASIIPQLNDARKVGEPTVSFRKE